VHVSEYSETLRSSCVRGGGIDGYGYGDCPNVWVYLLDSDVDYDTPHSSYHLFNGSICTIS
jgi:hypothetical protein